MDIKAKRESKNLTQEELGKMLKVSRSTIAMWETNDIVPRSDKLLQLAKIFGCTIDELYGEKEAR